MCGKRLMVRVRGGGGGGLLLSSDELIIKEKHNSNNLVFACFNRYICIYA